MKVEKVIGRTKTETPSANGMRYNANRIICQELVDLPPGTPIKLVAEIEAERKLIRPEDAAWVCDAREGIHCTYLTTDKTVIGDAYVDSLNRASWGVSEKALFGTVDTVEAAQLAAEHALADAGLYGFSWGEPHYVRYVYSDEIITSVHDTIDMALGCNRQKSTYRGRIYGKTITGELVIVKQWPEAEGEN